MSKKSPKIEMEFPQGKWQTFEKTDSIMNILGKQINSLSHPNMAAINVHVNSMEGKPVSRSPGHITVVYLPVLFHLTISLMGRIFPISKWSILPQVTPEHQPSLSLSLLPQTVITDGDACKLGTVAISGK